MVLATAAVNLAHVRALVRLGWRTMVRGKTATARRLLGEALMLGQERDERSAIALALLGLGMLAILQGDYPTARARLEESLALYRLLGGGWGLGRALGELGRAVNLEGDHARARALLEEATAIAQGTGEPELATFVLEVRGEVALAVGDETEAGRLWEESLAGYNRLGLSMGAAAVENALGHLALCQGDSATACLRYRSSLAHQRGLMYWTMRSLAGLAAVAMVCGQARRALHLAGASHALGDTAALRVPGAEREVLEAAVELAWAALGAQAATAAWVQGQAMTMEHAVMEALEEGPMSLH